MVPDDLDEVLEMNNSNTPGVNALDRDGIARLHGLAVVALVAVVTPSGLPAGDGRSPGVAGFCLVYGPGEDYASLNYQWFRRRDGGRQAFAYLDRIAVAPAARRLGIATAMYGEVFTALTGRFPELCCEVNLRPRNESSLRLHAGLGFVEVGQQDTDGGAKTVSLLVRALGAR